VNSRRAVTRIRTGVIADLFLPLSSTTQGPNH